jgi:cation:H+ antiporter
LTLFQVRRGLLLASLAILASGSVLATTGQALAHQTNLGSSFVGATLLASTTSLPELSTTLGAVRLGAYSMAFANIFGSNAIMVALLFLNDLAFRQGPILETVDRSASFAATMGIVVTVVYLAGLIIRRHRVVLRMGIDSLAVLLLYALTLLGLFALRAG